MLPSLIPYRNWSLMRRRSVLDASTAMADSAALLPPPPTPRLQVWTTYPSMSACKAGVVNLTQLNDYCYGPVDGCAIGLLDAGLTLDELDQGLDVRVRSHVTR